MEVGDLVANKNDDETGIVIRVITDVEIPPLIEIMWEDGSISRTYEDDLKILEKPLA
tara:strand:+ start:502 stop:672 length:171 start_codon:yes stop_codon:yes gene_type:complete